MSSRNEGFLGRQLVVGGLVFIFALLAARGLGSWFFQTFNLESLSPNPDVENVLSVLTGFIVAAVIFVIAANIILIVVRRTWHRSSALQSGQTPLSTDDRAWVANQIAEVEQRVKELDEKLRVLLPAQAPATTTEEAVGSTPAQSSCPKCGQELLPDAKFCGNCGSSLNG